MRIALHTTQALLEQPIGGKYIQSSRIHFSRISKSLLWCSAVGNDHLQCSRSALQKLCSSNKICVSIVEDSVYIKYLVADLLIH